MNPPLPIPAAAYVIVGLLFGAMIGSFLNVVIYRLPRGLSLSNPPKSFCPSCKHPLGVPDLFPLFSWLFSRGKCRYCGEPVSSRYFWVELLNGSLFAVIAWQFLVVTNDPLRALFYALMTAALVAVIFIDWELYIIPDELNAALLVFGIAYHAFDKSLIVALWGALLGWGMLWGIALLGRLLFQKDAMGHGDIKMMRGVGALLGPKLLVMNMVIAVVAGLIIGLAMMALASRNRSEGSSSSDDEYLPPESIGSLFVHGAWYLLCLDILAIFIPAMNKLIGEPTSEELVEDDNWKPSVTTIPFGPYLAIGAIVCMLFSAPIEKAENNYLNGLSHPTMSGSGHGGFVRIGSKGLNWVTAQNVPREDGSRDVLLRGTRLYVLGGLDWSDRMGALGAGGTGNKTPFWVVTQRGESGVQDAC